MEASLTIQSIRGEALTLSLEGDRAAVTGSVPLGDRLLPVLRPHKAFLIELLRVANDCGQPATTANDAADDAAVAYEERLAIILATGVPEEWARAYAKLCTMPRPIGYSEEQWTLILNEKGRWIDQFAKDATADGWTPADVFDTIACFKEPSTAQKAVT